MLTNIDFDLTFSVRFVIKTDKSRPLKIFFFKLRPPKQQTFIWNGHFPVSSAIRPPFLTLKQQTLT